MLNKRLIGMVSESKRYIAGNVLCQWISLVANLVMMVWVTNLLASLFAGTVDRNTLLATLGVAAGAVVVRCLCTTFSSRMGYLASSAVKKTLREKIYGKLLRLGSSYQEKVNTSEVVQVAVEGVDQLETYFGSYLPQLFYAVLAPVTLFVVLAPVSLPAAVVLLVCVPLIPVAIVAVQRWAKKLLARYWGQYTALGDSFLENLQGLTTLKIYQADGFQQEEMNRQAEKFRKITMKVLTMQLNSITIMDLIAYGGAALGMILSVTQYRSEQVTLAECLLIIVLAADFFLPMRLLGSYFHIAMNGMAASEKIFRLLDLPEAPMPEGDVPQEAGFRCRDLRFSYQADREVLHGINLDIPVGSFTAIVGESGCGKSTVASILMGRNRGYRGTVTVSDQELSHIREDHLLEHVTYVGHQSYLFQGTVRDNLRMGCPTADETQMWAVLERVKLADFLRGEKGLDTPLLERAANLSGGQCQRLALARALLHDSPVYLFDEATSNIDIESENAILAEIQALAQTKTVLLISHRLANVAWADHIYVMEQGNVVEQGTHEKLCQAGGRYQQLWQAQMVLEHYGEAVAP
ncbi:ABC transporter ATP-binding protein/permease [Evtepia sp.]|uniref:ABC transporter ATP-binding protein/permease n=1 Tax=Evtepia sp. TaxID=2773933 RepID=UPI002E7A3238|nr:ABC transporter ATP-binding protein/permease [Evtepia sp.]MEE0747402.1 ABC transporter ATP-binding protein/permease [Evtepia sp.]